ncbi:uncharacterized protein LOC116019441 isoform X1 [Ipomoea triloba]|uniref:uncharacterized protein LOC116019441 isoform X1 n=1 Tax=Ipomoea triloba TaxID=35885 RepID=UPI00125D6618|nr:uncharacterized protein LOC116019441 isoform X1 [Ipomoea triloba]XP_031115499.1 uncharacterized protein LOC116019441 isoform X1 [Ipomoea triloba]
MRFKRGSKVEVMNKAEVPVSWRRADILSRDGHTYTVRFDSTSPVKNESMVERVSRKFIRPCPPSAQGGESWFCGDIVEVFNDYSWKVAIVLKVFRGDYYLVRLVGCFQEFSIHRTEMRSRQFWQDKKWVLMCKGNGECGPVKSQKLSTSDFYQKMSFQLPRPDPWAKTQDDTRFQDSHVVSARSLKRMSPYCSSAVETHSGNFQKLRIVGANGQKQRVIPAPLLKKVDDVACQRKTLGEKNMHASFSVASNRYNEMDKAKLDGALCYSYMRSSESSDSDRDASSVGSCSVTSSSTIRFNCHSVPVPCQVSDAPCSDAESVYCSGDEEGSNPPPLEEDFAESIHRLELHAYHCTLEALHASGPLTWEQEALLTNLRIQLHISNDEHLMELKNLISPKINNYAS